MMNEVINYPGAVDSIARIVNPDLVACGLLPVIVPFGRIETQKNLLYFRRICVELFQDFSFCCWLPRLVAAHIKLQAVFG